MQVVLIILLLLALFCAFTAVSGAPWVPTRQFDVEQLLDDAGVTVGTHYLELGCGDGRLLAAAARRGATVVGYELNPILWLVAWLRNMGTPNTAVCFGDFWRSDLGSADVIMAFLVPRTMPRLGLKADTEIKSSARLVSYIFEMPGRKPYKRGKSWLIYKYPYTNPKKYIAEKH